MQSGVQSSRPARTCSRSTRTTAASEETAARVGDRTQTVASPYRVVCGRLRRCGRVRVRGDRGGEPVPITAAAGVQIRARRASPGRGGQQNSCVRPNNKERHFGTSKEKLTRSRESTNRWMTEMDGSAIYRRKFQVDAR